MKLTPYVKVREEKFGSVIFETLKEKVFVANETANDILGLLQEGKSKDEIIEQLAANYDNEDRVLIEKDTDEFIDALLRNGLVSDDSNS